MVASAESGSYSGSAAESVLLALLPVLVLVLLLVDSGSEEGFGGGESICAASSSV